MATVDVILREKVDKLGAEADVVSVKRGFARNYLLPQGKAYEATKGNLRQIENLKKVRAVREAEELAEAEKLAARVKKHRLNLELATGQGGKAFGSITTIDLQKAIKAASGVDVDRHDIELEKPIKTTGKFDIPVKLHPEVTAIAKLTVKAKSDEEEEAAAE